MDNLGRTVHKQQREWEQLRLLTNRAESSGLKSLSEQDLQDLPGLYRKTLSDLSLLRTRNISPALVQDLSQLCNRAHSIIYRGAVNRRRFNVWEYFLQTLPATVRRRKGYVYASALVMVLFAVIGYIHCSANREIADSVLSPRMVRGIEASLKNAHEQADLGLAAQIPVDQRNAMALAITLNNISVSVRAFVFGIAGGVITLVILGFNGYMLGAITQIYLSTDPGIDVDLPLYFFAGIAPHGSIELPAICLAAAAGLLLGFSWLFPGIRPRGEALRIAAVDAWQMVVACALTLVFAGMIEGFITPLLPPANIGMSTWYWIKIAFGLVVFLVWLSWLMFGGKRAEAARKTSSGRYAGYL